MPPAPVSSQAPSRSTQRKRNRKRKKRNVSDSSSSSSSSSDSESENEPGPSTRKLDVKTSAIPAAATAHDRKSIDSESESDSSDSEDVAEAPSESDSDESVQEDKRAEDVRKLQDSPPPPRTVPLPPLIDPSKGRDEAVLKETFRKRWMASMADAFASDLEQIRKEPNLTQSKLGLLIDSLASGVDVYARNRDDGTMDVDDARIVLEDNQ